MYCNDRGKRALNLTAQMDISRSTIDRENWKIKNRKISAERNIRNKGYDQARGRTCVGFCLNMLVCHLRLFPRSPLCQGCVRVYVWGGDIKIGARSCWGYGCVCFGAFKIHHCLAISLSAPLRFLHCFVFGCLNWQGVCFRSSGVHTLPETRLSVCAMNTAHEYSVEFFHVRSFKALKNLECLN